MNLIGLPDSFGRLCALTFLLSTSSQPIHGWSSTNIDGSCMCGTAGQCEAPCSSSVEGRHRVSSRPRLLSGPARELLELIE